MELKEKNKQVNNQQELTNNADQVDITYYTDPLCCWSWAFEPQWRKLLYEFNGKIKWQYIMGGLIPSWKNYSDELNSVTKPIQMGPVWMQATHLSGMPMPNKIWMEDPPASSYPACIAVKCAQLQSAEAGEKYLRLIREAVMLHGKNIAKQSVLTEVAQELSEKHLPSFNVAKFAEDLTNDNGIEAFRKDLQQVQYKNINRFPTLIIKHENNGAIIMTGHRPYNVLVDAITTVAPALKKTQAINNAEAYKDFWGSITEREIEEAVSIY